MIRNIIKEIRKEILRMPMTSKEMIKFLKKNGFREMSQNGFHLKQVGLK